MVMTVCGCMRKIHAKGADKRCHFAETWEQQYQRIEGARKLLEESKEIVIKSREIAIWTQELVDFCTTMIDDIETDIMDWIVRPDDNRSEVYEKLQLMRDRVQSDPLAGNKEEPGSAE